MGGKDSSPQNWSTHSEQPWQVQSQLHFLIAPFVPATPLLLGLVQVLWCRGREGALVSVITPCLFSLHHADGLALLSVAACQPWTSVIRWAWKLRRVSKDGLNFRAPGWCCLKWLVTPLHLSALVPLKQNPTFSRTVELPHPGSKNTLIHQLLFKRCFYWSSRSQEPGTLPHWLWWWCIFCVQQVSLQPWALFKITLVWCQRFAEEGTELVFCDLIQVKLTWRTSHFFCHQRVDWMPSLGSLPGSVLSLHSPHYRLGQESWK